MSIDDAKLVVRGWISLSDEEKSQVYEIIKIYCDEQSSSRKMRLLHEIKSNIQSIDVGPVGSGRCPYCGR